MLVEAPKMVRSISIPREALWAFGSWALIFLITIALGEVYLRSSTPAGVALAFTERNPVVQNAVGGAVHAQLNWIGSIHYEGDASWATFRMEVSGARANATMDVTLQQQGGRWNVANGRLVTDSGQIVHVAEVANRTDRARAEN
jgi:Cytochrome oxidase complex assembly protein 1